MFADTILATLNSMSSKISFPKKIITLNFKTITSKLINPSQSQNMHTLRLNLLNNQLFPLVQSTLSITSKFGPKDLSVIWSTRNKESKKKLNFFRDFIQNNSS